VKDNLASRQYSGGLLSASGSESRRPSRMSVTLGKKHWPDEKLDDLVNRSKRAILMPQPEVVRFVHYEVQGERSLVRFRLTIFARCHIAVDDFASVVGAAFELDAQRHRTLNEESLVRQRLEADGARTAA
jgi:hypothetical protein